jgi:Flp pilus assembly protein TadG
VRPHSGQAIVELAVSVVALLVFAFCLLAVGHAVGQYMAIRSAASQAAFAAARAPSEAEAQRAGRQAAVEAISRSQLQQYQVQLETRGFQRGGLVTATSSGCVGISAFPIASRLFGPCIAMQWSVTAVVEPYRSRAP